MINIDDRLLSQVTADELWLLVNIAKRLGKDYTAYPSNATLLKDTRWKSEKTLNKVKKQLIEKGIVEQVIRFSSGGGQTSNLYKIHSDYLSVMVKVSKITEQITDTPPCKK